MFFIQRLQTFFYFCHFFTFCNVFLFLGERFLHLCRWESISCMNQSTNNMYHRNYLATAFSIVMTSVKSVVARIATLL